MRAAGPELPTAFTVPILPKVNPYLREFVFYAKVVYLLNCPLFDPYRIWRGIPGNQGMGAIVALHHVDDGVTVEWWAKGTPALLAIIFSFANIGFVFTRSL